MVGESRDNPVFMKFIRDEQDNVKWGNILLLTVLTIASGYLASRAQRLGANPDITIQAKMKLYKGLETYAAKEATIWSKAAQHFHELYEIQAL